MAVVFGLIGLAWGTSRFDYLRDHVEEARSFDAFMAQFPDARFDHLHPPADEGGPYVVVLRPGDRVVVHQRAAWKDVAPSAWDLAFGGVCGVGEGWLESATRELAEEAGLTDVPLTDLGQGTWTYVGVGLWRQLPAGVPGAYRLMANLISKPRGAGAGTSAGIAR